MFTVIHGVVGALVRGYGGVAVDPYVEVGDHFAGLVGLVVLVVFHVRQNRLFRFPVPSARSAADVVTVVLLDKGRIAVRVRAFTEAFFISVIAATAFLSVVVAAFLPKARTLKAVVARAKLKTTSVDLVKRMPTSWTLSSH
jgi:hypothetical protein